MGNRRGEFAHGGNASHVGQISLRLPQRVLGPVSLDGNLGDVGCTFDQPQVAVVGSTNFIIIRGKGSQHDARGRDDGL